MNFEAVDYNFSFNNKSLSPDFLLSLLDQDLGFEKGYVSIKTPTYIRLEPQLRKKLQEALEKDPQLDIVEKMISPNVPGINRLSVLLPAHRKPPHNIIWVFQNQYMQPPPDTLHTLLTHPDFVFAFAEDEEDSFRQNTPYSSNYEIYRIKPVNVKFQVSTSPIDPDIDTSDNPGREEVTRNARLAIGWKQWFGLPIQQQIPAERILSFDKAYKMHRYPNGVIEVQLFKNPKDALENEELREIQRAFRKHIGLDELIRQLEDETERELLAHHAARDEAKKAQQAAAPRKSGFITSLLKKFITPKNPPATSHKPIAFGYKTYWYAVKTEDPAPIKNYFSRLKFKSASWQTALNTQSGLFISPSINGWSFIRGYEFPNTTQKEIAHIKSTLETLSAKFGKAVFFGSHRVSDYYSWALAEKGQLLRGFATGDGTPYWDEGNKIGIEKNFSYSHESDQHPDTLEYHEPNEDMVLDIAADWSVSPLTLDDLPPSQTSAPGWLAIL